MGTRGHLPASKHQHDRPFLLLLADVAPRSSLCLSSLLVNSNSNWMQRTCRDQSDVAPHSKGLSGTVEHTFIFCSFAPSASHCPHFLLSVPSLQSLFHSLHTALLLSLSFCAAGSGTASLTLLNGFVLHSCTRSKKESEREKGRRGRELCNGECKKVKREKPDKKSERRIRSFDRRGAEKQRGER